HDQFGRAERLEAEAGRARAAQQLHLLADRLRFVYGADGLPAPAAQALERRCAALWAQRGRILEQLGAAPGGDGEGDLPRPGLLGADRRVRLARAHAGDEARRAALRMLAEAEELFGPSPVLSRDRQAHAAALGLTDVAHAAARQAAALPPRTAWE